VIDVVLVASGGMDSVTLAYDYHSQGRALRMLTFDYGQRHRREIIYAARTAATFGVPWDLVDLTCLGPLLTGSALTDSTVEVPHGHYAAESMRATVVPNRNAVMLSIATAVAVAEHAPVVAAAVHAGDHYVYPDCRPGFIDAMDLAMRAGNESFGHPDLHIDVPYLNWSKADIAARGFQLGVPYADTWSCYEGGEAHCGRCGTCVERHEAFAVAGVPDPTEYAT
jgi:7-cyano-7-deazaguanine synthase